MHDLGLPCFDLDFFPPFLTPSFIPSSSLTLLLNRTPHGSHTESRSQVFGRCPSPQDLIVITHPHHPLHPHLTPHTNIYSIARHPPRINITQFRDADQSMRDDCPTIKCDPLPLPSRLTLPIAHSFPYQFLLIHHPIQASHPKMRCVCHTRKS